MQSRLEKYLLAEEGLNTVHEDEGFFCYQIWPEEKTFFVGHFAVDEEKRSRGNGQILGRKMETMAKEMGCEFMLCNVFRNEYNSHSFVRRLKCFEDFGFEIKILNSNHIRMVKTI